MTQPKFSPNQHLRYQNLRPGGLGWAGRPDSGTPRPFVVSQHNGCSRKNNAKIEETTRKLTKRLGRSRKTYGVSRPLQAEGFRAALVSDLRRHNAGVAFLMPDRIDILQAHRITAVALHLGVF